MLIGTLFSIILSVLLWFDPHIQGAPLGMGTRLIITAVGLSFLFLLLLGLMFAWLPLQKAEHQVAPRILEMFRRDKHVLLASGWIVVFSLVTFVFASDVIFPSLAQKEWFFPFWVVLLGISVDVIINYMRRVVNYLNPFAIIQMFADKAKACVRNDQEAELCGWIDALGEVAIKGMQKYSTSVCHEALTEEQEVIKIFLATSKGIAHVGQDEQLKAAGISDKVSYTLFYLYQRLDIIFDKALKNQLEPTCSFMITLLGKIAIEAAKYDVSLASPALRFLGKFAKRSQEQGFEESAMTSSCVFLGVAKEMISEIDLSYYEIKDPFLSIINGMEVLSKETFKRDKTMSIQLLMQPFKVLRALFENEKMKNHQDTPIILQNIDRVLSEYEALLVVMNTMPPLPKIEDDIAPAKKT